MSLKAGLRINPKKIALLTNQNQEPKIKIRGENIKNVDEICLSRTESAILRQSSRRDKQADIPSLEDYLEIVRNLQSKNPNRNKIKNITKLPKPSISVWGINLCDNQ